MGPGATLSAARGPVGNLGVASTLRDASALKQWGRGCVAGAATRSSSETRRRSAMASQVATHEAGHLYASITYGIPVEVAAITPDHAEYHGVVSSPDEHLKTLLADDFDGYGLLDALDDEDTAVIRRTIMVMLAGAASERG